MRSTDGPEVVVLCGTSVDGRLNTGDGASSSRFEEFLPDDVDELLVDLRRTCDGVGVGIRTVLADDPQLLSESNPSLRQVVVDSRCRLPLDSNLVEDDRTRPVVLTTTDAPVERRRALSAAGVEVVVRGDERVDLPGSFDALEALGIDRLLVEGGGTLIHSLVAERLLDELRLVVFPFVVGDVDAVPLLAGDGFDDVDPSLALRNCERRGENHCLLEYELAYGE